MTTPNDIKDFIEKKIQDELSTSYDDIVVLATFGFIVLTNDEYKTFFNKFADDKAKEKAAAAAVPGTPAPPPVAVQDLENDDWEFEPARVFGFVSERLLKTVEDPAVKTSSTHETTNLTITFGKSFTIDFNNEAQNDATGGFSANDTKTNFEENFVNLAQVFYETQFCVEVSEIKNSIAPLSNDKINEINVYIGFIKAYINTHVRAKTLRKSLKVLYYKPQLIGVKLDNKDFSKFVEFERIIRFNSLKTKINTVDSNMQHQIVVLDDKKLTFEKFENKILKKKGKGALLDQDFQNKYVTIILVIYSDAFFNEFQPKYITAGNAILGNIRIILIKKGTLTVSAKNINTLTYQCENTISHEFKAKIEEKQGTNTNITTITYENDPDLAPILKYTVLSNVSVFIEARP